MYANTQPHNSSKRHHEDPFIQAARRTQPAMQSSPFDAIRKVDELGHEYWNAKDLAKLLGYRQYSNFTGAIRKAEIACRESGEAVSDHFLYVQELIKIGKGAGNRKFCLVV